MMDVVLVRLPFVYPQAQKKGNVGTPPLGLAYLAAALRRAGFRFQVIDSLGEAIDQVKSIPGTDLLINGLEAEEIIKRIPADAKIIGVSCMFTNEWYYCRTLLKMVKQHRPDALLVLGGEHPTADPDFCFREAPMIDVIVMGEGEETLVELVRRNLAGEHYTHLNGICYQTKQTNVRTPARKRIQNLDSIAWPDWDSIPIDQYLNRKISHGIAGKRGMPLLASRGCPFRCTFCSNPVMWGAKWNVRNCDDVVAEIKYYVEKYQISHFDFFDLTAIIQMQWIKEFCEKMIAENLQLTWALPTGTRSEALSPEVLSLLKKAGCLKLVYAPESGSRATLTRIKKKVDLRKMMVSMRQSVNQGIVTRANIVIGFPGQTVVEVFENYLFVLKLVWIGLQDIAVFAFSPYPGSELHDQLVKNGQIVKENSQYTEMMARSVTNNPNPQNSWNEFMTHRQIAWVIWSLVGLFYALQFLLRPWRLLASLHRFYRGEQLTTLEVILPRMLKDLFRPV